MEAQVRNFYRWPSLGTYIWPNAFVGETYDEEMTFLRDWLGSRLEWLDINLASNCVIGCSDMEACNYNPEVSYDDGSCLYAEIYYDCDGNCLLDSDVDLVCDELDNCPQIYNPDQLDLNENSIGDACEGNHISVTNRYDRKDLIRITDLLGRSVSSAYSGVVFYHFKNGAIVKSIQ